MSNKINSIFDLINWDELGMGDGLVSVESEKNYCDESVEHLIPKCLASDIDSASLIRNEELEREMRRKIPIDNPESLVLGVYTSDIWQIAHLSLYHDTMDDDYDLHIFLVLNLKTNDFLVTGEHIGHPLTVTNKVGYWNSDGSGPEIRMDEKEMTAENICKYTIDSFYSNIRDEYH